MTTFSELPLIPTLAHAIADRGYEVATPVQVAVLEEKHRDRDLLVSSQTGSGKTLAFGALIAQSLLGEPAPKAGETASATENTPKSPARRQRGRAPKALIIAPTRELANQVRGELAWLFAKTGLQVAAFTGGSDTRRDLSTLQAGVDLAVGTPGRLVDLVNREALHLDAVAVAVLDEADEMLDMGFRDDLEILLGKASSRVRTHMFSATLPRPILSLAAKYQKDAVRISARSLGEGSSHEDIHYLAHIVAMGDRLPAVVNVLRQNGEGRAIVFGTTREGVADLHRELVRRGFRAVVLSGDRAQTERNRALSALRAGEAQVLVATNVAARGLDLPEVDLVLHADLPLNVEALTHRSGRTGRAGRKGKSILIATVAERRKAERLLSAAGVDVKFTPAPSAEILAGLAEKQLEKELRDLAQSEAEVIPTAQSLLERLSEELPQERLLQLLLMRELSRIPQGETLRPVEPQNARPASRRASGPPPSRDEFSREAVIFKVNLGAESKAEPGWLLPLICRRGGITRREVGAIRVFAAHSEFEIAGEAASDFDLSASLSDPRAPHVHFTRSQRPGRTAGPSANRREETKEARPRRPDRFQREPFTPKTEPRREPFAPKSAPRRENFPRKEHPTSDALPRPTHTPITFGKFRRDTSAPAKNSEGGFTPPRRKLNFADRKPFAGKHQATGKRGKKQA